MAECVAQPRSTHDAPREVLGERFARVRVDSERLCAPLAIEDHGVQSMADVSPPNSRWSRA